MQSSQINSAPSLSLCCTSCSQCYVVLYYQSQAQVFHKIIPYEPVCYINNIGCSSDGMHCPEIRYVWLTSLYAFTSLGACRRFMKIPGEIRMDQPKKKNRNLITANRPIRKTDNNNDGRQRHQFNRPKLYHSFDGCEYQS